jgi:DNA-binding winged helix-turn-helix (wHTH) protein/tetratricopeptide (TPR) repeat protein
VQVVPVGSSAQVFQFGLFEADVARNTLTRNGVRVKIQDQPFRVLVVLLEHAGEIVTREELRQGLWPDGTYVDFDGSLNVILKKLRAAIDDNPDNPVFIETIPRRGYRFIAPVTTNGTKSEPAVVRGVRPDSPTGFHAPPAQQARSRRPHLLYSYSVLAVFLLLTAGGIARYFWRIRANGQTTAATADAPVPVRKSLAVLGFQNVSARADDGWLSTALSEMLSTELAGGEKLRLVSGEDVVNLRLSAPWMQADTLNQETTSRIGTALNSDYLILGSYTAVGDPDRGQLRVDVRLQEARTGQILSEVAELGSRQDLFRLVSLIGSKLRERLGIPELQASDAAGVLAALPLNPEAARFYALGLEKLRAFDALAAKDLLVQATQADPKFSLAHAMLARAWSQLGYEQKRKEEARKAVGYSTDLPRAQRMLVEGDYYESLGNHEKAASIYHALCELFPDNVDYGLALAAAQHLAGNGSQSAETIAQLRRLPQPASDDPLIDLAEANVENNKSRQLALIRSALNKSSLQNKKLVYALARKEECLTLNYTDHPEKALPSCQEAYEVFKAAGNRLAAGDCLRIIADTHGTLGQFEQAITAYQRALSILAELGEHEKTGAVLNNMAILFENEGKLDRAEQLYQQAKSHFEQAGDRRNVSTALGNMGDVLYLRGDLNGAAKLYQQALQIEENLDLASPGYLLYRLADVNLTRGHVRDAQRLAEQGVAAFPSERGAHQYRTAAMLELGEILKAEDNLRDARQQFEETLAIRENMGAMGLAAESRMALAELDMEEKHPEQAEPLIRSAIAELENEKGDPALSTAYVLLSRASLMQGKADDARRAIEQGIQFSHTSSDPALTLSAAVQRARVEMAALGRNSPGSAAAIARELHPAVATARRLGYYSLECEARLLLGELEVKTNPAAGRAQLSALAAEAHNHGLELLARHAQEAISASNVVAVNESQR